MQSDAVLEALKKYKRNVRTSEFYQVVVIRFRRHRLFWIELEGQGI